MSSSRCSTPIRWLITDTPFIPPVDEEDLPSHQPQQPLYWNILLLIRLSSERQIKIRKIQCFTLRHELEDILDDGLASRQNMTPSAIGEFLIRISNGKFGAGQCPIPQDVDVTDFGDLSEADDSVLLHLMAEPKENYVRAPLYVDGLALMKLEAVPTSLTKFNVEMNTINVPSDGTCTLRDRSCCG